MFDFLLLYSYLQYIICISFIKGFVTGFLLMFLSRCSPAGRKTWHV